MSLSFLFFGQPGSQPLRRALEDLEDWPVAQQPVEFFHGEVHRAVGFSRHRSTKLGGRIVLHRNFWTSGKRPGRIGEEF